MSLRKRSVTRRLFVLNNGRTAYLDFLRNLTPQVLLMTIGLIMGTKIGSGDWIAILSTVVFIGAALLAFWLNAQVFHQQFSVPWKTWRSKLEKRLTARQILGFRRRTVAKLRVIWRFHLIEFVEQMLVMYLFLFALVAVMAMAGFSAMAALGIRHAG